MLVRKPGLQGVVDLFRRLVHWDRAELYRRPSRLATVITSGVFKGGLSSLQIIQKPPNWL